MIDDFLKIIESVDFEDFGSLRLVKIECAEENLDLVLEVSDDENSGLHPNWKITCSSVRENNLSLGYCYDLDVYKDHVLLWEYVKPKTSTSFYGSVKDSLSVVGALYERHVELAGDWIPFQKFINSGIPLSELIAGSFGMLADGPAPLILAYEEVLQRYGISTSHIEPKPPMSWRDGKWVLDDTNLSVLILGNSYVIATDFDAHPI